MRCRLTWMDSTEGESGTGKPTIHNLSGPEGIKYDRIELLDLDGDGDLDVLTCEEEVGVRHEGLGVIWYENPTRTTATSGKPR